MSTPIDGIAAGPADEAGQPDEIRFRRDTGSLGQVLVATTPVGICAILIGDDPDTLVADLAAGFPASRLVEDAAGLAAVAADAIACLDTGRALDRPLDPRGTPFQRAVWTALRDVPAGATVSYSKVAERIGAPGQAYAVGAACAANMIAVAIPCHRVVRKDGGLAGYRWGYRRKRALLAREAA